MGPHYHHSGQDDEARRMAEHALRWTKAGNASRRRTRRHVDDLERDVRFLGLLSRALLDVLLESGACTLEDVAQRMEDLDALDGATGDGLDPRAIGDELGVDRPDLDEAERFQESLQRREDEGPSDRRVARFTAWLEERSRRRR